MPDPRMPFLAAGRPPVSGSMDIARAGCAGQRPRRTVRGVVSTQCNGQQYYRVCSGPLLPLDITPTAHGGCLARGARGARARCDCSPVDLERRYHRMLPKSGHRGLSITTRWPIVVFGWKYQCPGVEVGSRALCALENIGVIMFCLLCFPRDRWQ